MHIYVGVKAGLFELLAKQPSLENLIHAHKFDPELLGVWLKIARVEGLVREAEGKYVLTKKGLVFSSTSSTYANALVPILVDYWAEAFRKVPELMKTGQRMVLGGSELDTLVARLSRSLELPSLRILRKLPQVKKKGCRVLDVGCGLGSYLVFLAKKNPTLEAVGVELASNVASSAIELVQKENLQERITIVNEDVRKAELGGLFDLCILSQVYYYLSPDDRIQVLAKLKSLLSEGGVIAVMVPVLSESWRSRADVFTMFFHFLQRAHSNMYGIPTKKEVYDTLGKAGLTRIRSYRLFPGSPHYYFVAGLD